MHQPPALAPRVLAVGGTHVIEAAAPCRVVRAEPAEAVRNLEWKNTLALEASGESHVEVACDGEQLTLRFVAPATLIVEPDVERQPPEAIVGAILRVRARLYDRQGQEIEIGKFSAVEWSASEELEPAIDRSAAEFGFCDTCFGMYAFTAVKAGIGWIEGRFDTLAHRLTIRTKPKG